MRTLLALMFLMTAAGSLAVSDSALFENTTEFSPGHWTPVPGKLARTLIRTYLDAASIAEYQQEGALPRHWRNALVWTPITASKAGPRVYFVRPPLTPYYSAMYGAHAYMHWLVRDGRPIFAGASDGLQLMRSAHHGLRDIEERSCMTSKCAHTTLWFDGAQYQPVSCRFIQVDPVQDLGACGVVPP